MSYILISNVGTLINKYRPIISSEILDILSCCGVSSKNFDLGSWFEWSFNHILKEVYYLEVRNHHNNISYQNIYNSIEPDYVRAFNLCLDRNTSILETLSPFLTVKAVLSHETVVIVASSKIDL